MRQDSVAQLIEEFSRKIAVGELTRLAGYLFKIVSRPLENVDVVCDDPGSVFVQAQCGFQPVRNFQPTLRAWIGMGDRCDQYLCRLTLFFRYSQNDNGRAGLGALLTPRVTIGTPKVGIPDDKARNRDRQDYRSFIHQMVEAVALWTGFGLPQRLSEIVRQFPRVICLPRCADSF